MEASGEANFGGVIGKTHGESIPWWPQPVKPPEDAPNVVFVVLDDVGAEKIFRVAVSDLTKQLKTLFAAA